LNAFYLYNGLVAKKGQNCFADSLGFLECIQTINFEPTFSISTSIAVKNQASVSYSMTDFAAIKVKSSW
jgi:hypothetical protein